MIIWLPRNAATSDNVHLHANPSPFFCQATNRLPGEIETRWFMAGEEQAMDNPGKIR